MTRQQMIALHREQWGWLCGNPEKNKEDWPRWRANGGDVEEVEENCFLCEWNRHHVEACTVGCLLVWPDGTCAPGLYTRWCEAWGSRVRRVELATAIRDLPENERHIAR